MGAAQQRRTIAVAALVTFGMGVTANIKRSGSLPSARFIVGWGTAFMIVSIMSDLGSPMGAGFAVLIMLAAFLSEFDDVAALLGFHLGPSPTPPRAQGSPGRMGRHRRKKGTRNG